MDERSEEVEETPKPQEDLRLTQSLLENIIKEIIAKPKESKKAWFSSPILLALVGLIGTGIGASVQGYWNMKLERQKFESSLIEKSIGATNREDVAKSLNFLVKAGLVSNLDPQKIAELAKDPEKLPVRFGMSKDPFGEKVEWKPGKESHLIEFTDDYELKNIISITIPQLKGIPGANKDGIIRIHRKVAEPLKAAFAEIEAKGLLKLILSWDGSYYPRKIMTMEKPSAHAFGTAFDINYMAKREKGEGSLRESVRELVPIFEKHGFQWSGKSPYSHDAGHFYYKIQNPEG